MDYLLSRHPIFGAKVNVAGYEIRSHAVEDPDSTRPQYSTLTENGLTQIVGNHYCFLNLTEQALAEKWWRTIPSRRSVLGYFDDFEPDSSTARELLKLQENGARIALSGALNPSSIELFGDRIYAVKLDVTSLTPDELEKRCGLLRKGQIKLLAGSVDTYDDLEYCKTLGFDLYQGHFISRMATKNDKDVPVNRLTMMRILSKLQDADLSLPDIEKAVSLDAALSYKLLSYANSAAVALPRKVNSVGHAIRMVGVDLLRSWASVLLLSSVDNKPRELLTIALVRARMCELLAGAIKNVQKETFFSTGLLSVIDALLDCSMEKALEKLPLVDEVKNALVLRNGPAGQALRCAIAYEQAEWDEVQFYGMSQAPIRDIYMDSLQWARQLAIGLLS